MRKQQGGTKKWCPSCKEVRVVAARNPALIARRSGQRWFQIGHEDLQFFRRGLECQHCYHEWLTAEVEEGFLDELVELRNALRDVKANAERYIAQSKKAAVSLGKLTASLEVLRALKVYEAP